MFYFRNSSSRRDTKLLFGRWAAIKERDDAATLRATESEVKKFLMTAGFVETSTFILDGLATLIVKNCEGDRFKIGKEYDELAQHNGSGDSFRQRLSIDIQKNINRVASYIKITYDCDIGEYRGNKNFVKIISAVYMVYILK